MNHELTKTTTVNIKYSSFLTSNNYTRIDYILEDQRIIR